MPPMGEDAGHVVPVSVGDQAATMRVAASLASRGYLVGAVRPPTVPEGTSRLRVTVSAAHEAEHIRGFVETLVLSLRG